MVGLWEGRAAEECRENVLRTHEILLVVAALLLRHAVFVAIPVIHLLLLLVRQALHGLPQFFERFFGAWSLVFVGVKLQGQLLVGALDLVLAGIPRHLEDVIVVPGAQDPLGELHLLAGVVPVLTGTCRANPCARRAGGARGRRRSRRSCGARPEAWPFGLARRATAVPAGTPAIGGLGQERVDGRVPWAHALRLLQEAGGLFAVASGNGILGDALALIHLVPVGLVGHRAQTSEGPTPMSEIVVRGDGRAADQMSACP
mmetsp:Transcript_6626/g.18413  ORF Transcript_6626/g.18413 Transcript_6626/m.18413 type:complete len:259 (+) Transcript_6626:574-1350(+)